MTWTNSFFSPKVGLKAKVSSIEGGLDGNIYSLLAISTPLQQQMLSMLRALICWTPIVVVDRIPEDCDPQVSQVGCTSESGVVLFYDFLTMEVLRILLEIMMNSTDLRLMSTRRTIAVCSSCFPLRFCAKWSSRNLQRRP